MYMIPFDTLNPNNYMVFSDTTNKNGIIQTCELLLDLGDAGISGNPSLLKQFTNLINRAYDNVGAQLIKYDGSWTWDDYSYGNSNLPSTSQNLTVTAGSEVNNYSLPAAGSPGSTDASSFLRLIKVQVLDASARYQNLLPVDDGEFDQPLSTVFYQAGSPKYYRLVQNSVEIYPKPLASQVTATNGLRIIYQRDKIDFVSTDTTKQPGFQSIYHYLIPLEASEAWAAIKGLRQLPFLQTKKAEFMQNLGWGVANRDKDLKQRLVTSSSKRNPNYI